jgi:hypothetical protein
MRNFDSKVHMLRFDWRFFDRRWTKTALFGKQLTLNGGDHAPYTKRREAGFLSTGRSRKILPAQTRTGD